MKRSNRKDLNLHTRMTIVLKEIKSVNPDIICIQETNWHTYKKYFLDYFFDYEFKYCDNYGSNFMNIVGYRKSRFIFLSSKQINLSDVNVDGNRGVLNVMLRDKATQESLCLYNVHFPWKPQYEVEKLQIMRIIFEDFLKLKIKNIIIAGDFNSLPYSLVLRSVYIHHFIEEINQSSELSHEDKLNFFENYSELKTILNWNKFTLNSFSLKNSPVKLNFLETNLKSLIHLINDKSKTTDYKNLFTPFIEAKQGLNILSAYGQYQHLLSNQNKKYFNKNNDNFSDSCCNHFSYILNHPRYTNYTEFFKNTIDYIFHSENLRLGRLLILPEKEELSLEGFLPSSKLPSDHIKLFAEFYYTN